MDTILSRTLTVPNCIISFLGFPNEHYARGFTNKILRAFSTFFTASALIIPGDVYKSYSHHNIGCIHAYVCAYICLCVRAFLGWFSHLVIWNVSRQDIALSLHRKTMMVYGKMAVGATYS